MADTRPHLAAYLFSALFPLAFTGLGTMMLSLAAPILFDGFTARDWPEAPGHVMESRIEEVEVGSGGPNSKHWYELRLVYRFEVAGQQWRGSRIGLYPEQRQLLPAQQLLRETPPGLPVRVFYDPADPGRALLDRTVGWGTWALLAGSLPLLLAGWALCVGWVRAFRAGKPPP